MSLTMTRLHLLVAVAATVAAIAAAGTLSNAIGQSEALDTALPRSDGQLLVSEFTEDESTLFLVDPTHPAVRQELWRVRHAPGWELVGAVSPSGDAFAYLVLPPGATDPAREMVLILHTENGARFLSSGFDIGGGLLWSRGGESLFLRRSRGNDQPVQRVVQIDVSTGLETLRFQGQDSLGVYPVAKPPEGPLHIAVISPSGSVLMAINDSGRVQRTLKLSGSATRDWALSPDGSQLAFTEQRGLQLNVRVVSLASSQPTLAAAAYLNDGLGNAQASGGSAAPAWHPDGSLSVGTFQRAASGVIHVAAAHASTLGGQPGNGFVLPLAWSEDGSHLALRTFSGSGPGAVGEEKAAVMGPGGGVHSIEGRFVSVLGWWYGSN